MYVRRMLTMMPISAMTLAGVSPSLLQIYTESACREIRRPVSNITRYDDTRALPFTSALELAEYVSVSVWRSKVVRSTSVREARDIHGYSVMRTKESCAKDPRPVVQAAVSRLLIGKLFMCCIMTSFD